MTEFLLQQEPWRKDAVCRVADTRIFFPARGRGTGPTHYAEARSYCVRCPVRIECLEYAIRTGQEFGMYGGATPSDRKKGRGPCSTSTTKVE